MLLGSFLLFAKLSRSKFEEERESGGTRQGEGLQRGAELPGKEKEKLKEKERKREKEVHQTEKYRFKESGIGNSWLIGDDSGSNANAYVNGINGCEETLEIPHKLKDELGQTKKVEVIGQYAFCLCGEEAFGGITRSIVLSRYIKVIKYQELGAMSEVTSFRIEEGSCLESIESYGLTAMSWKNRNDGDRRSILVLPSTVTNIAGGGLEWNNLINTIYYCGSTHLSNYCELVKGVKAPDIKVTKLYSHNYIFGNYTPNKNKESIAEAEKICDKYKPDASPSPSPLLHSPPAEEDKILSKCSKLLAATHLLKS